MSTNGSDQIHAAVRDRYASAARAASDTSSGGPSGTASGLFGRALYESSDTEVLPTDALTASLGCGNPTMLADLQPGDVVLDLGSGGGIDVLLSARRVGPTGMAYGLDMTPEMLDLARKNQVEAGLTNVEFLQGTIEDIPLPDATVDVVISNCVVNLSPDKDAVIREAFRVLKPGGTAGDLRHRAPSTAVRVDTSADRAVDRLRCRRAGRRGLPSKTPGCRIRESLDRTDKGLRRRRPLCLGRGALGRSRASRRHRSRRDHGRAGWLGHERIRPGPKARVVHSGTKVKAGADKSAALMGHVRDSRIQSGRSNRPRFVVACRGRPRQAVD